MFTKHFVSCVLVRCYFFAAAHFHLAANISHFLTAAMKFSCFSSNEIRLPSSFSVIHVSLNIKNNVEKDTTLLFFFSLSLKVRAAMRFFSVAFGLPYLLIELFYNTEGKLIVKFRRNGKTYEMFFSKLKRRMIVIEISIITPCTSCTHL